MPPWSRCASPQHHFTYRGARKAVVKGFTPGSGSPVCEIAAHTSTAVELFAFVVRAGIDQRLQRVRLQYHDRTMLEPHPAARSPGSQLLVDAFARHPDHLADFLLGDRDDASLRRVLVLVAQAKQRARETARKVLKDDLLDLIAGPAQPPAQQCDQLHRDRRLAAHEGNEFASVNGEELSIAVSRGVGR